MCNKFKRKIQSNPLDSNGKCEGGQFWTLTCIYSPADKDLSQDHSHYTNKMIDLKKIHDNVHSTIKIGNFMWMKKSFSALYLEDSLGNELPEFSVILHIYFLQFKPKGLCWQVSFICYSSISLSYRNTKKYFFFLYWVLCYVKC